MPGQKGGGGSINESHAHESSGLFSTYNHTKAEQLTDSADDSKLESDRGIKPCQLGMDISEILKRADKISCCQINCPMYNNIILCSMFLK